MHAKLVVDYIRYGYIKVRMSKSRPQVPLTPAVFHILLALFCQERHGYDIMQQVKSDSEGAVKMGPGTLYGSLDRMIEAGLVAKGNTQDPRRIYYKLTMLGQAALRAETERLSRLAVVARRQLGTA
jgi:DNA-binding PadR family transcriptional regulator